MGHIHAELMAQYAEDAKTHAEPWKLWQVKADGGVWRYCRIHPVWAYDTEYRRKPKTHIVNGVEIPDLRIKVFNEEALGGGCIGYCADPLDVELHLEHWNPETTKRFLELGILYEPTEEGKQAAILHAKAWLGTAGNKLNERVENEG